MPLDLCAIFFLLYLVSIYSLIVDFSSEFYLSLFVARTRRDSLLCRCFPISFISCEKISIYRLWKTY